MIPGWSFDESRDVAGVPWVVATAVAHAPAAPPMTAAPHRFEPAATRIVLRAGAPKFSICAVVVTIKGIKQ
jgi:hypothetical protein